jgi:hypothetical protein
MFRRKQKFSKGKNLLIGHFFEKIKSDELLAFCVIPIERSVI